MKGHDIYAAKQKTVQFAFFASVEIVKQFAPFVLASQFFVASQHISQFVSPQTAASFRIQQILRQRTLLGLAARQPVIRP